MKLTNYQRCIILLALQQRSLDCDPEAVDVLIERLSADAPWSPCRSLSDWAYRLEQDP